MTGEERAPSPDDEAILRALGELVAATDPVPAGWRRAAWAGFDWLALDAELAEVAYDSVEEVHRPLGPTPGESTERRRLRFELRGMDVEIEMQVTSDTVRLLGRVTPCGTTRVQAVLPEGSQVAAIGETGSFRFDELPRGPVSLLIEGIRPVKTGWIVP